MSLCSLVVLAAAAIAAAASSVSASASVPVFAMRDIVEDRARSPCMANSSLLWVVMEGARAGEAGSTFSVCAPKCAAQDRAGVCLRWRSASVCRPFAAVDGTGSQTVCVLPCVTTQDCGVHHWRLACVGRVCAFPEM